MTPKELQDLLDELEASRASRKRAWENLQEIRWVLKDSARIRAAATGQEDHRPRGSDRQRRRQEIQVGYFYFSFEVV
jgi:hypothetical protein